MKKLSIVVTAYNIREYIGPCLDSIVPQLTPECELLIVEDYSSDGTLDVIYGKVDTKKQTNITILTHSVNCGVSVARNTGMHFASGKYITFIDGDDIVASDYVSEILKATETDRDVYLLSWMTFGTQIRMFDSRRLPKWNNSVWSRVIKKKIIGRQFDPKLSWAEDVDFLNKNIKQCHTVGYIEKSIYRYRWMRKGSITEQHKGK